MMRLLLIFTLLGASLGAHGDDWARRAAEDADSAAMAAPVHNLFPRQTWQPPPPPPPPEPPPPKPVAPPLPFQYRGSLQEGSKTTVFLAQQLRQIIAKKGDVIDNTYRIDAIAPHAIDFTYLPLEEKQQLSTGRIQ